MLEKLSASWGGIRNGIKGVIDRMFGRTNFADAALPKTLISDEMGAAIERWVALYKNEAPWLKENRLTLGLPASIAQELATLATLEAKVTVSGSGEKTNPRSEFMAGALEPLLDSLAIQTEYACAFGGVAFRPYVDGSNVAVDFIGADRFYPISFNARGEITGAVFVEKKRQGQHTYTRAEEHELKDNGVYVIRNHAYRSYGDNDNGFGTPCPLSEVPEWSDITPEVTINGMERPLFAYFRIPQGNVVKTDSPLGVSVYAKLDSAGIIEEADRQFQRLSWEYEGGEMAIDAASDAFDADRDGHPILPKGKERLYRMNELFGSENASEKFKTFAPTLRDDSYARGLNRLLMQVEDKCGLARGTFSDAQNEVRTATELRISKQRTYATVTNIQMALQRAIDDLAYAVDAITTLYQLAPAGAWSISYAWDDSVVVDAETERETDRQDVIDGIMKAWEYRMKWYGETEEMAKAATGESMLTDEQQGNVDRAGNEPEAQIE